MHSGAPIKAALGALAAAVCLGAVPGAAGASVGNFGMAVQPNGKIVVASGSGRFGGEASGPEFGAVVRYLRDGSLDRSFGGGDGVALLRQMRPLTAVALQPDGKILVTAPLGGAGGLARLLPNGRLDPSFGTGGILAAGAATSWHPTSVAVGGDGSIFVGGMTGYLEDPAEHWYGRLYRIAPDGRSGDWVGSMTSGDGRPGEPKTFLSDFLIGDDGKIAGAGSLAPRRPGAKSQVALARLIPGTSTAGFPSGPDPSFGSGVGLVTPSFFPTSPAPEAANSLSFDKGRLLVAGEGGGKLLLARYSADGAPDSRFGRSGLALAGTHGPASSVANAVTALRKGGSVVAGSRAHACGSAAGCERLVLARFKVNGEIDARFGVRGYVRPRIPVNPAGSFNSEVAYDVASLTRGRILVGGLVSGRSTTRLFLRRFLADGKPDRTFGFGTYGWVATLPLMAGTPAPGSGR
jgi:uncharacterized delta-60 repeat protein